MPAGPAPITATDLMVGIVAVVAKLLTLEDLPGIEGMVRSGRWEVGLLYHLLEACWARGYWSKHVASRM